MGDVHWMSSRWVEQEGALGRALGHAERAAETREVIAARMRLAMALYWGPTPAPEAIERAERILEQVRGHHAVESTFLVSLAGLHAMSDRFDEARTLLDRGESIADELGFKLWFAGFSLVSCDVELLAGNPVAAERKLRRGYSVLEELGERRVLSLVASRLAMTIYVQGRYDEAEQLVHVSEQLAGGGVIQAQIENGMIGAKLAARRGDLDRAESLAREAVQLARQTDDISGQGAALLELAAILRRGHSDEATMVAARARDLFEQKGNVVAARAAGAALAAVAG
jgi:ATP/maltotriose-dependent transcriptional regulator MalT